MIAELDMVALTRRIGEYGLEEGDVGTVVHLYKDGMALEVEFVDADGRTIAVLTLAPEHDVRLLRGREILHVREIGIAA